MVGRRRTQAEDTPQSPRCASGGGRADLLAAVAALLEGASEGGLEEPMGRQAAV